MICSSFGPLGANRSPCAPLGTIVRRRTLFEVAIASDAAYVVVRYFLAPPPFFIEAYSLHIWLVQPLTARRKPGAIFSQTVAAGVWHAVRAAAFHTNDTIASKDLTLDRRRFSQPSPEALPHDPQRAETFLVPTSETATHTRRIMLDILSTGIPYHELTQVATMRPIAGNV